MSNGILLEVIGESCTEGFMNYSLLEARAANPSGSLRNNRLSETNATRWIIIEESIRFTCDTVITEILIGVDIRTVNDSIGRNLYPKFEVWSPTNNMMTEYTRVISIEIRLTPDNFTTNGQYRFTLPTPLNVSSGYRIGMYQPPDDKSVVRFHYMSLSGGGPGGGPGSGPGGGPGSGPGGGPGSGPGGGPGSGPGGGPGSGPGGGPGPGPGPGLGGGSGGIDGTGKVQSNKINDTNIKISGGMKDVEDKSWEILIHPIVQDKSM